ncbi:MAG: SH3 domain-containing protein [Burkholderiales bacterium]|nr:SH3 domain-containing protein [Burkholderiales bacterium]
MKKLLHTAAATCLILVCAAAAAQAAVTKPWQDTNMHAGPDTVFPVVTRVTRHDTVQVQGCIEDFTWCDVVAGRRRGWVHRDALRNVLPGRVPVVAFSVESYWDAHYRDRRWFADKAAWVGWGTPGWAPPPPRPRGRS